MCAFWFAENDVNLINCMIKWSSLHYDVHISLVLIHLLFLLNFRTIFNKLGTWNYCCWIQIKNPSLVNEIFIDKAAHKNLKFPAANR
jgi:hypothetical protein